MYDQSDIEPESDSMRDGNDMKVNDYSDTDEALLYNLQTNKSDTLDRKDIDL